MDTKWNFEALCHTAVRKAKQKFNTYIQEMSPNQKYTQPRNVRPKIPSNPDTEPLEFETFQPKDDQVVHQNLHPEILQAEDLIFDNDRIHPVNHRVIPISINTIPNEKQKLLIVIAALRMGYRETDPVRIRNHVI